jgi:hypothetical protein
MRYAEIMHLRSVVVLISRVTVQVDFAWINLDS